MDAEGVSGPKRIDLGFLDDGAEVRRRAEQRRARIGLAVSVAVTVAWLAAVTLSGSWGRVADRWVAALTMVFGSFVAGATPQGGGAVAFPVFTKVLDIAPSVARTFSLCIQAVGMGTAAVAIVVNRRPVVWAAVAVVVPTSVLSFLVVAVAAGDGGAPFRPAVLPGAYVKVTFTMAVAALAVMMFLAWRLPVRLLTPRLPTGNRRVVVGLAGAGVLGGAAAALVGSGADLLLYLLLVVLLGFDARIGVATSVVVMAVVSVVGFVVFGLIDGQLAVSVSADRVVEVGGRAVDLPADRFDLLGLWLAAVPVVAWGAPLGSLVASRLSQRRLVLFVLALAAVEVVSTVVFLSELRSDPALAVYAVVGSAAVIGGLVWLARHRDRVFALEPLDPGRTLTRRDVDIAADYVSRLDTAAEDVSRLDTAAEDVSGPEGSDGGGTTRPPTGSGPS